MLVEADEKPVAAHRAAGSPRPHDEHHTGCEGNERHKTSHGRSNESTKGGRAREKHARNEVTSHVGDASQVFLMESWNTARHSLRQLTTRRFSGGAQRRPLQARVSQLDLSDPA